MTARRNFRVFSRAGGNHYESTTLSKKSLCQLQDRKAQECAARDLQKPASQATSGLNLELLVNF